MNYLTTCDIRPHTIFDFILYLKETFNMRFSSNKIVSVWLEGKAIQRQNDKNVIDYVFCFFNRAKIS